MARITNIKVKELKKILNRLKKEDAITDDTEIWLSSDEEGNSYSPFVKVDKVYNIGIEPDKSKITLYPISI